MQLVRPITVDDDVLIASNVDETEGVWSVATTYALGAQRRPTASGADTHRLFESAQDGNAGHDPLTDDGTWWFEVGVTNRMKMFDGLVQSQTTQSEVIDVTLQADGRVSVASLQNISAAALSFSAADAEAGEVYRHDEELVDDEGIDDWYAYFTEDIVRKTDVTLTDLPAAYSDLQISVRLTAPGDLVGCGLLLVGQAQAIGGTRWGGSVGIRDYSTKEANAFGEYLVVERAYAKTGQFEAVLIGSRSTLTARLLTAYRATPVLLIGSADYAAMVIYGFVSDWRIEHVTPRLAILSIEFEGLT
jgi:hypothetical protein